MARQLTVAIVSNERIPAYAQLSKIHQKLWINTFVSMLHSILSSSLVIASISSGNNSIKDLVNQATSMELATICISTGYFIYDLVDFLLQGLYLKSPEVILHHVVVLFCYIAALIKGVGIPLLSLALICELHSAFMHVRKLMSLFTFTLSSSYYRKIWRVQWITFGIARFLPHLLITAVVYLERYRFNEQSHFWTAFIGMLIIDTQNLQLFRGLLVSYSRESKKHRD
uniref:Uncharacterized protein AlNc14C326G10639 n=1 Tax=Albugo laibachii Nc14 TaxID=890382 RepID=F0WGF1_9STRA|nr:conserved hypothetical protein [Albugo laibachii Nc14]CCA25851.1 conserved hypothetical protein [Albugo laibachii Nc14]|eukprot:CCA25851.1 conserved hypothetical protein [Albugo laibachii Nc14]